MKKNDSITFKAGLLGAESAQIKVFYEDDDLIALEKPVGVLVDANPLYPDCPTIIKALTAQKHFTPPFQSVYHLDPVFPGIALIAKNRQAIAYYRNLVGSYKIQLVFKCLMKGDKFTVGESRECSLPLARDTKTHLIRISHSTGKKAQTHFTCIELLNGYSWWEASTTFCRDSQVVIHAFESDLPVVGDTIYSKIPPIFVSDLKTINKNAPQIPIYPGICIDLVELRGVLSNGDVISKPLDYKLSVLDQKLRAL